MYTNIYIYIYIYRTHNMQRLTPILQHMLIYNMDIITIMIVIVVIIVLNNIIISIVCTHIGMYVCVYTYIYIYTHVCICVYIYIYIYIYRERDMNICVYIYIYIHKCIRMTSWGGSRAAAAPTGPSLRWRTAPATRCI